MVRREWGSASSKPTATSSTCSTCSTLGNAPAKSLYAALDYRQAVFGPERDTLEYWEKAL